MPLLGKKTVPSVKPITGIQPHETIFTIAYTGELFRSREEYEKRLKLYKDRVWTCQCTGHINLTHEEALNSEKTVHQTLKSQFLECYEKPVLELVHHSTLSLDTLVDHSWLKLQQCLSLDEAISLKVKTTGKCLNGNVVRIHTDGVEANPTSNCNSPSSDKENAADSSGNDQPKKWVPPKLLAYKYSIKLEGEDKVINLIPASDLVRGDKPPSKELLRLFIRAHAVRVGNAPTSPWVVDQALVAKFQLPSKFVDFLLSPSKMAENARRAEEEAKSRKRKSSSNLAGSSDKKAKAQHDNKKQKKLLTSPADKRTSLSGKSPNINGQKKATLSTKKINSSTKKSSPYKNSPKNKAVIEIDSESSDDEVLINLLPLSVLKEASPKKGSTNGSAALTPRKRGRPRKEENESTPKKRQSLSRSPKKGNNSVRKNSKKSPSSKVKEADSNKRSSPRKTTKPDKKGMKQMTLFEMKGQKSMSKRTPQKTPDRKKIASPPPMPAVVKQILKAQKAGNRVTYNMYTTKAAKQLTALQRSRLPEEIKAVVVAKHEKLEENRKLKLMSPAEREAYLVKKKEDRKKKLSEKLRAKNSEMRKRYEDQDLELKPIPQPKLVPTPDGLPNELFGEIAMVTEFISAYAGLLMPDDEYPIQSDALMKSIGSGPEGFAYLSRVLKVLLQTLLQDGIAEDYGELDVALSDIPVTPYTVSELVRLCLRKQDDDSADADADNDVKSDSSSSFCEEKTEVPEEIIHSLESTELYQLDAGQKLQVLKGLCLRIMGTYSVQDYMEQKQTEATRLWREKMVHMKANKKKREAVTEEQKNGNGSKQTEKAEEKLDEKALTLSHFYGKKENGKGEATPDLEPVMKEDPVLVADPSDIDLAGVVKRRRVLAARAAAEKVVREKEEKIRREKEAVEMRKQKEKENFEKSFNDGIVLAKLVLRQVPIGTDRNHNRYWIFTNTTPGLFIEKGWVTSDIEYRYSLNDKDDDDNSSIYSMESDGDDTDTGRIKGEGPMETTFPHTGQNLWFLYDSVKDLDTLLENLHPNGIRESALKVELKKKYSDIVRAINMAKRTNNELRDSHGDEEMLAGFKKELQEFEMRLRNGGLGGVPDYPEWERRLMDATEIGDLGSCLTESHLFIMEKFLKGMFAKKEKKSNQGDVKPEPEEDEEQVQDKEEEKEDKAVTVVERWREAIENCPTLSRLHVLMGILDSCVRWEKSAENAKCKICRKKGDDSQSLLCDECNQAFHLYCLRPALPYIPDGEWYCPACKPLSQRRRPKPGAYRVLNGSSDDESDRESDSEYDDEEEEKLVHDENCLICGGDEGLAFCSECPSAFHLDCHDPPLRHTPRSNWVCIQCKTGVRIKTKNPRAAAKAGVGRRRKADEESSEEESEEEDSEEDSEEEFTTTTTFSRSRSKSTGTSTVRSVGTGTSYRNIERVIIPTKYKATKQQQSRRGSEPSKTSQLSKQSSRRSEPVKKEAAAVEDEDVYDYMKPRCKRGPSDLSLCEQILGCLFRHKSSWPFQSPVNKKEVPDYHMIIKKPMDFQTIKNNILCFVYSSPEQFVEDVSLVFRNAAQYNKIDSEVYTCMLDMEEYFTELLRKFLPECRYERETTINGYGDVSASCKRPRI